MNQDDPLIVIRAYPFSMADPNDETRFVASTDFQEDGVALIPALVSRLKSFGFDRIIIEAFSYPAYWISDSLKRSIKEHVEDFCSQNNVRLKWFPIDWIASAPDRRRMGEFFLQNFAGVSDEIAILMDNRSLFVPRERILAMARKKSLIATSAAAAPWESAVVVSRETFAHLKEHGRPPGPTQIDRTLSAIGSTNLPSTLRFGMTREFSAVFSALNRVSPAEWSYDLLLKIYREEPERFFRAVRHVGVEVTNNDNLPARLRSPSRISSRPTGTMIRETWNRLVEDLEPHAYPVSIDIWDFGEPLLHEQIVEMIADASTSGIRTDLYTNGILLDETLADRLLESGLNALFVRLDAATRDVCRTVSGDDAHFDLVRGNLSSFLLKKKSLRAGSPEPWTPIVAVQITEMAETRPDFEEFQERYDYKLKIEREFGKLPPVDQFRKLYEKFPPIEYSMIRHDNLMRGKVMRNGGMDVAPVFRFPCRQVQSGPYVLWTGEIVPCREDYDGTTILGTVSDGINAVMAGERMRKFQRMHVLEGWPQSSLCASCKEWFYGFE